MSVHNIILLLILYILYIDRYMQFELDSVFKLFKIIKQWKIIAFAKRFLSTRKFYFTNYITEIVFD